jgi:hypothetical protein
MIDTQAIKINQANHQVLTSYQACYPTCRSPRQPAEMDGNV